MPTTPPPQFTPIVVMGVSGCGKTVVGTRLAEHLGVEFFDGDKLHPATNIEKMQAGIPLNDEDRWPWLDKIARVMGASTNNTKQLVVACSALRQTYREFLAQKIGHPIRFVHLQGSKKLIAERLATRDNHFMPNQLLDSQFATLEAPDANENVITINIDKSIEEILSDILGVLKQEKTTKVT